MQIKNKLMTQEEFDRIMDEAEMKPTPEMIRRREEFREFRLGVAYGHAWKAVKEWEKKRKQAQSATS